MGALFPSRVLGHVEPSSALPCCFVEELGHLGPLNISLFLGLKVVPPHRATVVKVLKGSR